MKRVAKGVARRLRRWLPARARPAILMYHRIAVERFDPWGLAVEEERFLDQVQWLSRNRTVMPLSEFAERQRENRLPPEAVAMTFDDGYACALPVAAQLKRLNLPATIFIAPDLIERGGEFWWDDLARIILEFDGHVIRMGQDEIPVPQRSERDQFWAPGDRPTTERQALFQMLWARLRMKPPSELGAAMSELRQQSGVAIARDSHRLLTAEEVREAGSTLLSFGSHALTHPSLPALSESERAREIRNSRSRCANLTGAAPTAFAYPYGDLNRASLKLVRDVGFDCACSTAGEFVNRRSNRFALPRLKVGNWDVPRFADMLGGQ